MARNTSMKLQSRLPGIGLMAIALVAVSVLAGCPWSPEPDDGGGDPVSNYLPQTSPANVLANLQTAYSERKIEEYRKLFTEDFTFVFNPLDPEDPENPNPDQWGIADELEATKNMFEDELVTKVELTSYTMQVPEVADSVSYGPDAWKVRVDETNLQVATRLPDGDVLTLVVQGTTEVFYFREDDTKPVGGRPTWYIFRWEDQPIGSKTSAVASVEPGDR